MYALLNGEVALLNGEVRLDGPSHEKLFYHFQLSDHHLSANPVDL